MSEVGIPGVGNETEGQYKKVLETDVGKRVLTAPKILDGSEARDISQADRYEDVIQAGMILGKKTANDFYAPSILGVLSVDYGASDDDVTLDVGTDLATEIARRIGTGAGHEIQLNDGTNQETGQVDAVDTAAGTVTLNAAYTNDYATGSLVQPTDGSEDPLVVLGDGYGVKVTDTYDNDIDVELPHLLIGGHVRSEQIVFQSDMLAGAWTWCKSELNEEGDFTFTDDFD